MTCISADDLLALATRAMLSAATTTETALATARALVYADARGLPSHRVSRLPMYIAQLRNGRVDLQAKPAIIVSRNAAVLIDAADGMAYPACELAIQTLIGRARKNGSAVVSVRRSHHLGAAACHLEAVGASGMVGFAFSNAPAAMPT